MLNARNQTQKIKGPRVTLPHEIASKVKSMDTEVDGWLFRLRADGNVGKEVTTGWSTVILGGNEMS